MYGTNTMVCTVRYITVNNRSYAQIKTIERLAVQGVGSDTTIIRSIHFGKTLR